MKTTILVDTRKKAVVDRIRHGEGNEQIIFAERVEVPLSLSRNIYISISYRIL